jgi:hypothetical protein
MKDVHRRITTTLTKWKRRKFKEPLVAWWLCPSWKFKVQTSNMKFEKIELTIAGLANDGYRVNTNGHLHVQLTSFCYKSFFCSTYVVQKTIKFPKSVLLQVHPIYV